MKRAALVTGATIVGVVWILNYKVAAHQLGAVAAAPPTPDAGNTSATPSPFATPRPSPTPSPAAATGTFTGSDFANRFGDVVVRVVLANGHISDVQAVQLPTDRAESAYISQQAGPLLRSEALQAQSANIDIISGATYTSASYAQSLESALKKAHLG
jgi:uncharacterized protein with FMN-binding domain